jgi:predicted AAA+ superfamily ATPase
LGGTFDPQISPLPSTSYYGELFENFVVCELKARCHYLQNDFKLSFLRTKADVEIDLVIERPGKPIVFVEIKSTKIVRVEHAVSLLEFVDDFPEAQFFVWSCDDTRKQFGKVLAVPWSEGLQNLLENR